MAREFIVSETSRLPSLALYGAGFPEFIDKFELPFPLLADTEKQIHEKYGTWVEKSMYGRKYMGIIRSTFVIGKDGIIKKVFEKVKPEGHALEVLESL